MTTSTSIATPVLPIRKLGHVKFFNSTKGYGFIIPTEPLVETIKGQPSIEVFVHHTAIMGGGFKSLAEGEMVEYDLIQGPKGMQAANVSGPEGKSVRGDPNAHRPYHYYRYQSENNHHLNQHHSKQHHYKNHRQQQHNYGYNSEGNSEGMNEIHLLKTGHLGYTMYGMPYGYHPIYPTTGPYMIPTTGYYHPFTSSQSSPQLKPSIAMYYSYPIPPPTIPSQQQQQQQSFGILSNSSSSLSSNHTTTTSTGEPEIVKTSSSSSPSC